MKTQVLAPVVVSILVLLIFGSALVLAFFHTIPQGSETLLNVLIGGLGTSFANVVAFWTGSSAGSRAKDALLAAMPPLSPKDTP